MRQVTHTNKERWWNDHTKGMFTSNKQILFPNNTVIGLYQSVFVLDEILGRQTCNETNTN